MSKERCEIVSLINEARKAGARQSKACEVVGITAKTFQRWSQPDNQQDGRLDARHEPANKLTELERKRLIKIANEPAYADLSPSKIVPKLADQGIYVASESTFNRVLKAEGQLHHRQKARPARQVNKPRAITATAPNQLYSWDITYCVPGVQGKQGCLNEPRVYLKYPDKAA